MKKLNSWYTCIFLVKYHCYQTHYKNAQQHQHTRTCFKIKKNNVVCRFHYPLSFMHETKKLKSFQINRNDPFSQQYIHTQANQIFRRNDDISIFEYLNDLNFDESTYILNLRSKLKNLHIFQNKLLKT